MKNRTSHKQHNESRLTKHAGAVTDQRREKPTSVRRRTGEDTDQLTDGEGNARQLSWVWSAGGNVQTTRSVYNGLTVIDGRSQGGTYVLRIHLSTELKLAFGRFRKGKPITLVPGEYAYVGSALSERGATCLSKRLLRHATRCGDRPPHRIRGLMLAAFPEVGLSGCVSPLVKSLRWNVDHLLDREEADLVEAFLIRNPVRIEAQVGKLLERDPASIIFEKGLGANDIAGNTHLLRITADDQWWNDLGMRLLKVSSFIKA